MAKVKLSERIPYEFDLIVVDAKLSSNLNNNYPSITLDVILKLSDIFSNDVEMLEFLKEIVHGEYRITAKRR